MHMEVVSDRAGALLADAANILAHLVSNVALVAVLQLPAVVLHLQVMQDDQLHRTE
jgi:hypothetical protein